MPVWELNILLQQVNRYLPHLLYGVHAVEAERNQPDSTSDATALPGMQLAGGF
jgi:hypothetical protein